MTSKCQTTTVRFSDSWSSQGLQTLRAAALEQPTCLPSCVCHPDCNWGVLVSHESQWRARPWDTAGTGCSKLWGQLIFRRFLKYALSGLAVQLASLHLHRHKGTPN